MVILTGKNHEKVLCTLLITMGCNTSEFRICGENDRKLLKEEALRNRKSILVLSEVERGHLYSSSPNALKIYISRLRFISQDSNSTTFLHQLLLAYVQ